MFLDVVKAQRQDLQDYFIQDFHPVLLLTFVAHNDEIVFVNRFLLSFSVITFGLYPNIRNVFVVFDYLIFR